jgi:hypothetical protein
MKLRGGTYAVVTVRNVNFRRMGYSGDEKFAEVEVSSDEFDTPLIATFKQEAGGELTLVNVTGNREERSLDWYENNLHTAFPDAEQRLFESPGGEEVRRKFAADVLACNGTEEVLKDKFYYGE